MKFSDTSDFARFNFYVIQKNKFFLSAQKIQKIKIRFYDRIFRYIELGLTYLSTNYDVFADAYVLLAVTVLAVVQLLDQCEPYVQLHFVSNGSSANLARMLFIGDRENLPIFISFFFSFSFY